MINLIKGDSADLEVTISLEGGVYDITSHKIWFTIKNDISVPDVDAVLQVTDADGISILDGPNGDCLISLTPTQTDTLPLNETLQCDVQIRTPEGKVYTVLFDSIAVTPRVTLDFDHA